MSWEDYSLPSCTIIEGKKIYIDTGWTNIIDIFSIFDDEELLPVEKAECLLRKFYRNVDDITDFAKAFEDMLLFVRGNDTGGGSSSTPPVKLVDWKKDLKLIIPPVNKVLGYDVRERPGLHWWTFLGAYKEIGECTFQTYVGIRHKIAHRKKLETYEKEIYAKYKDEIVLSPAKELDNFDDEDILVKLSKQEYLCDE